MRRDSLRSAVLVAAASLLLAATPASAALITEISWDVTGGTFDGTVAGGAITGGSVVWTAPGGGVTTAFVGPGGTLQIVLSGTTGYAKGTVAAVVVQSLAAGFKANVGPVTPFVVGTAPPGSIPADNVMLGGATSTFMANVAGSGSSTLFWSGLFTSLTSSTLSSNILFAFGNEVRTVVPEPSTATLFGLGLLALGGACGGIVCRRRA